MKKLYKILTLVFAVMMLASSLAACGGGEKEANPAVGTWNGQYTKFVGDDDSAKSEDEVFTLVLNDDGSGKHSRDGLDIDVTWELDGQNVKMTESMMGMTIEYTGTVEGTALHLFNGDPEDIWTCEYVYEKAE